MRASAARPSLIFVFDFDRSFLVNDTDVGCATQLGLLAQLEEAAASYRNSLRDDRRVASMNHPFRESSGIVDWSQCVPLPTMQGCLDDDRFRTWTTLMSDLFRSFSPQELAQAAADCAEVDDAFRDVFRTLLKERSFGRRASLPVDVFIASDANSAFIGGVLSSHIGNEVEHPPLGSHIHTNPCFFDAASNRSYIVPYAAPLGGHACSRCNLSGSRNMCKGAIVEYARRHAATNCQDATVVYVGDGSNDYCALSRMRARDVFLVREGFSLDKALRKAPGSMSLASTAFGRTHLGACQMVSWPNHAALAEFITELINTSDHGQTQQDVEALSLFGKDSDAATHVLNRTRSLLRAPLFTFGEDPWSFRRITLSHRMTATVKHTLACTPAECISARSKRRIDAMAEEVRFAQGHLRGTLVPNPLPAVSTTQGPALSYDEGMQRARGWQAEVDDIRRFWSGAVQRAAQTCMFPSPLIAYRRNGVDARHATMDDVEWSALPWLQGEMLFHRCLSLAFDINAANDAVEHGSTATEFGIRSARDALDPRERDHCASCNSPFGALECGCAFASVVACSSEHVAASDSVSTESLKDVFEICVGRPAPSWDQYRFEKEDMMTTTLESHIALTIDALYADVLQVAEQIRAAGPVAANSSVVKILEILVLNCLWGNAVDLCLTQSSNVKSPTSHDATFPERPLRTVARDAVVGALLAKVTDGLVVGNQVHEIAQRIADATLRDDAKAPSRTLDIVLDNAGVECAADLLLATAIVTFHAAAAAVARDSSAVVVCLHCKPMPWYVSDVVPHDIALVLQGVRGVVCPTASDVNFCEQFALDCLKHLDSKRIAVRPSAVWTSACELREHGVELFDKFFERVMPEPTQPQFTLRAVPKTRVVLFKGDLNFRRVIGDRHWEDVLQDGTDAVPFDVAVRDYWPQGAPSIACLRTCKCELVAGVPANECVRLDTEHASTRPVLPEDCEGDASRDKACVEWIKRSWRVAGSHAVALIH